MTFHPGAVKDLKDLDKPVQKQIAGVIDDLSNGRVPNGQTHTLRHPLQGWSATKASRGHRIIHRTTDEGGLHIGYIGLHEYGKAERRLGANWRPKLKSRIFGPTKGGLDPRLFDGDKLRPEVREAVLARLGAVVEPLLGPTWKYALDVYLAGSEASEWWGNDDLDVLVGIDYDHAEESPHFQHIVGIDSHGPTDEQITTMLNQAFWDHYNDEDWHAPFGGIWHATAYANPMIGTGGIKKIKPYAAYDIKRDTWVVKPPHLDHWSIADFPEGPELLTEAKAYADLIEAIDKMPEPYRTRQGKALWDHLHAERSRAFSDEGEGWLDSGNAIEKALNEWGLWDTLVQMKYGDQAKTASMDEDKPIDLPAEQAQAIETENYTSRKNKLLDLAKNPVPGTHIWRGETRRGDPVEGALSSGVGMHWGVNPDNLVHPFPDEGERNVVYHAEVEHPGEQNFPRSHPMWQGRHQSMDSEAEVRLRPGTKVKLHGVWVKDPDHPDPGYLAPRWPSRTGPGWTYHPIGKHVDVAHRPKTDLINYSDVGIPKQGVSEQPVEHVLVSKLWPHREWNHARGEYSYDREGGGPYAYKHDAQSWDDNKASVAAEGIQNPITLHYNPRQNAAYIGEGNHRLHWARELGHETVPVRVWRTNLDMDPRFELSEQGPKIEGHFPQDPRPSSVLPASWFPTSSKEAGKNGELPQDISYEHRAPNRQYPNEHVIIARHPDASHGPYSHWVGHLTWFDDDSQIGHVTVHPDYQRRGVATELYRRAQKISPALYHSEDRTDDGKQWINSLGLRLVTAEEDDDYRMQHRPPGREGMPLHDLTTNMPADVYTHPEYYDPTGGERGDYSYSDSHAVIRRVRGKPDAKVRIYRSLPAEHAHQGFRPGDWVTLSKDYARQHGKHSDDPKHDWPVISTVVKADDLHTDADDLREWGYNGSDVKPGSVAYKGGYHQEVRQQANGEIRPVTRKPRDTSQEMWGSHTLTLSPEDYHHVINSYMPDEAAHKVLEHLGPDVTWHSDAEDPKDSWTAENHAEKLMNDQHPEGGHEPGNAPLLGVVVHTKNGKTIDRVKISPHVDYSDKPRGFYNGFNNLPMGRAVKHESLPRREAAYGDYYGLVA